MSDPIRRALISVSDKTGLEAFACGLAALGVDLISTGGTAALLRSWGLSVTEVAAITGFPEIMDGRVKTLHPTVHGGLLAVRGNASHRAAMAAHGITAIDLLVVNLYPFEAALQRGAGFAETVETIDVGGPAMIRAGAKNHDAVTVVVEPANYPEVLAQMREHGGAVSAATRQRLAAAAFARMAAYDAMIAGWLGKAAGEPMPPHFAIGGPRVQALRYGENPHQAASLYATGERRPGAVTAQRVQGKELSYNNIADTDAAYECVAEFDPALAACVIVKHANPCGAAVAASLSEAYLLALRCDPQSAFGGILAFNRELDAAAALEAVKLFTEVIIAPSASAQAQAIIAEKKNLRLLLAGSLPDAGSAGLSARTVAGGLLVQSRDHRQIGAADLTVVTRRAPAAREQADLIMAARVAKHVKSNAIVYVRDGATVGIGAGQMSRVDSARIAALKSADAAKLAGLDRPLAEGAVVASEAFFPFADGLIAAASAGATAVIQPGGSKNDPQVIAAADDLGLAMVFTGIRQFRH